MKAKDLPLFRDKKAREVLESACRKHGVEIGLLQSLLEVQRENAGRGRQVGITNDFDTCIGDFLGDAG